ncbi:MAG: hypothetical protein WCP19_08775 [Chloroflexota bacterium]
MTVLFIFLDGVGLGSNDALINPLVNANMPNLQNLLNGRKLIFSSAPYSGKQASLLAIDANLGVSGIPQSATGQAVLLTGKNVPELIGYHYGPKPDKATAQTLADGGIFGTLLKLGKSAALLNAYPPGYFSGINSGKRMYSSIPLAVVNSGLPLFTLEDLINQNAISADFTGEGWVEKMAIKDIPVKSKFDAGTFLIGLSQKYDFAFFEYWLTDYEGHGQNIESSIKLLEDLDIIIGGILSGINDNDVLIITSDHGNLEDLSTRRHTSNPVPLIVIGNQNNRSIFENIIDLCGLVPSILKVIG